LLEGRGAESKFDVGCVPVGRTEVAFEPNKMDVTGVAALATFPTARADSKASPATDLMRVFITIPQAEGASTT